MTRGPAARRLRTRRAAASLASSDDPRRAGALAIEIGRAVLGPRDELVVNAFDLDRGTYEVLAGTVPGVAGNSGPLDAHPVLRSLSDLTQETEILPGTGATGRAVIERLRAARIRSMRHVPLTDGGGELVGSLLVVRRGLRRSLPRRLRRLVPHVASALALASAKRRSREAREEAEGVARLLGLVAVTMRDLGMSDSVEAVIGHVLRTVMDLDDALLGAVAATVSDGVIARVAATGTTPRTAVEDLSGTRLDGFPIGRRLLANESPIIAAEGEVSHATQTRIMQPIGARSLLAAAGRSRNVVRVVVSGYRSTDRPPGPAHLDAIEAVLAHAAANVVRIERSTQFAQVGAAVDEAILILGRNGDEVFSNDAARELLGSGSTDVRDRLRTLYTNEDGSDMDDLDDPIRHALAGEPVVGLVLRHRPTEAPHRVNVLPLAGLGAVITIRDISSDVAAATEAAPIADIIEHRERRAP